MGAATEPGVSNAAAACPFGPGPGALEGETGRPTPRRRGYLVPGVIALAACAAIALVIDVVGLQSHTPTKLVGREVETDVAQAVQAAKGLSSPPDVSCPASEPRAAGVVFDCTLVRPGLRPEQVRVTERSDTGDFHIQLPTG